MPWNLGRWYETSVAMSWFLTRVASFESVPPEWAKTGEMQINNNAAIARREFNFIVKWRGWFPIGSIIITGVLSYQITMNSDLNDWAITQMGDYKISWIEEYNFNTIAFMPPSYDLIIEADGLLTTVEVWAVSKEGAVSEWSGKKGKIRGVVFNEKNYKDD